MVKVLCYKSEGPWFDSRWCHWNFSMKYSFRSHYGPGVDSASNRNEYQEYFLGVKSGRCVRLTTLPPSCAVVMKSGNLNFLEPSGPLQACNGTDLPSHSNTINVLSESLHASPRPRSRQHLGKLPVAHLIKTFPRFYQQHGSLNTRPTCSYTVRFFYPCSALSDVLVHESFICDNLL